MNESGNHVVVITDVKYNQDGNIALIEVTEQTSPCTEQTVYYGVEDLLKRGEYGFYTLYRSKKVKGTELSLDTKEYSCYEKEGFALSVKGVSGGKIKWKSSNPSVAQVNQTGYVTAKKAGKATIIVTVTANGESQKAECQVTVNKKNLKIDNKKTVYLGYPVVIEAKATPADTILWNSSNPAIATVKDGVVTGLKKGTVKITAKANGVTKTCTVTVKAPSLKLNQSKLTLHKGESKKLTAISLPSNAIIKWSSSDSSIVEVDANGTVIGIKPGTATITVQAHGFTRNCVITVLKPNLIINKTTLSLYKGQTEKMLHQHLRMLQ